MVATVWFMVGELHSSSDIMLSQVPIDLEKIDPKNIDKEILRAAIIGELDAINQYEQMAGMTQNEDLRKVLLEVAGEEKTHVGEFQALLLRLDPEQAKELKKGKAEVDELTEK
jgi:rubrerythrin